MIAIAGGKGGCGKTTTTLAVARALARNGIQVRAIDLDAGMPNLHRMADVDREPSLTELYADPGDAGVQGIQGDAHGVEVVPAPRALDDHDLPAALDVVRPERGVALLDCPAGAGPAATAPLREADAAIVVTTDRTESVEDAGKTVRMARSLGVPVLGAIVTRTERASAAVEAELGVGRSIAVPHSGDPLDDERVMNRYEEVAESIKSWLGKEREEAQQPTNGAGDVRTTTGPSGSNSSKTSDSPNGSVGQKGSGHDRVRQRSESISEQCAEGACPNCGGALPRNSRSTHPRDRRSRRSRESEDARNSSRGDGEPSDRT